MSLKLLFWYLLAANKVFYPALNSGHEGLFRHAFPWENGIGMALFYYYWFLIQEPAF